MSKRHAGSSPVFSTLYVSLRRLTTVGTCSGFVGVGRVLGSRGDVVGFDSGLGAVGSSNDFEGNPYAERGGRVPLIHFLPSQT